MGTHYLIDLFANPLSGAAIVDVLQPTNGQSLMTGSFVIRLPNTASLVDTNGNPAIPTGLTGADGLITLKYQGLMAFYSGYENIIFDDLLDTSGIDFVNTGDGFFGSRQMVALSPGAQLQTTVQTAADTPTSAIFTWEVYTCIDSDPKTGRFSRIYNELPSSGTYTTAQVSFNGGSTWTTVTDGSVVNINTPDQGTQFVARIVNASGARLNVGSWAVIY